MKLVRPQQTDDLQAEIKRRFTEFNRASAPSKGRRCPADLKELVIRGKAQGLKPAILGRLTGLSASAVNRWLAAATPKPVAARRLAVVGASPAGGPSAAVVIRLSSGVTIELRDGQSLSSDLLATLSTLEAHHAASR